VDEVLHGGTEIALLEHVVEEPTISPGDALGRVDVSQIDRLEKLDPDVAFTSDLLGNDVDAAVVQGDDLHVDAITPVAAVQASLDEMMARLGKLHGHYFISNLPYLTLVPNVTALRQKLVAAGTDPTSFDAKVQQINQLSDAYNAALVKAMQPYPNLVLVDFKGWVEQQAGAGIRVGGELLTTQRFGGLFSLDGLHLTDTGYAIYANLILDSINATLQTQIPHVEVEAIHAQDPLAPSVLRAAGLECVPPPQ
jgi:lysophospholipase L1-like esterase